MTHDSRMAPPDLSWHEEYERTFHRIQDDLTALTKLPSFEGAEDLGDYVETLSTLLSFRPRTREDICLKVALEVQRAREEACQPQG